MSKNISLQQKTVKIYNLKNIPVSASNALLVLFLLFLRSSILYILFSPAAHLSSLGRLSAKTWSIEHQFEIDIVELQLSLGIRLTEYIYTRRALCKIVSLFKSENALRRDKGAGALFFSRRFRSKFWPVTKKFELTTPQQNWTQTSKQKINWVEITLQQSYQWCLMKVNYSF